jgi:PIN domain nuclease of toxin-antitoxin system
MKRYLLDSHVALWALTRSRKLGPQTWRILEEEPVFVSVLSVWELGRKRDRGLLDAPDGSLAAAFIEAGAELLPLHAEHVEDGLALAGLQHDPFDRMLVGTARVERMTLLTRDAELLRRAAPLLGPLLQEA